MTDPTPVDEQVARLARVRDEELTGYVTGAGAAELLGALVAGRVRPSESGPRRRTAVGRWTRRVGLAAALAAAVAVAYIAAPGLLGQRTGGATSYANAAIEVSREGDFYVARIKDPLADRARYVEAFRAVGKDFEIELVPVAPPRVGELLSVRATGGGAVRASTDLVSAGPDPVDCGLSPQRCMLVLRIAVETTGSVRFTVGRAARPGESYGSR